MRSAALSVSASTDGPLFLSAPQTDVNARRAATKLRNVLRLNTGLSLTTGAVALLFAGPAADLLGLDQVWLVRSTGAGLIAFATFIFWVAAARTSTLWRWSQLISFADFGWVVGTVGVIAAGWLSTTGAVVMGLIGLVVLELGISQLRARTRLTSAMAETDAELDESPADEVSPDAGNRRPQAEV